ncbi:MAG: amidohydrolase [Candidatus Eisenbacteria bacterium]|uniref:Amidohydrolase n=1 Tax=Eiseniibacteriota bacterium TaxID=2212470 RepID=A0A9D6LAJ5_UNCEI|nr:amidohydrolase [Candidatus Eisenbacteria bacterium]MBI3540025.1 amidohydrolase [Candidatus Eisenbacteria bacterium]
MSRARADLLIEHARPWSDGAPVEDADAILIAEGRIVAVGAHAPLAALAGPATPRLDARGGTVTPGFTDAHIHLVSWARSRGRLELRHCATRADALAEVAAYASTHPGLAVIEGRGWDANGWSEPPDRAALDRVTGGRPALLHSHDFHALWVNSAALARAGVTRATADPPGGILERDAAGEPNGVAREHAVRLFAGVLPVEDAAADRARVHAAIGDLHRHGITAVHDFEAAAEHRLLRAIATDAAGPRVRVLMHVAHAGLDHALGLGLASGTGDDTFRVGALKLFADGTLGSQTAAMIEPYEGSGGRGLDLIAPAELATVVARAVAGGLSVAIHAIGDRAVRSALDAFAGAGPALAALPLAPRIEHVQLLDPADLPRFASHGVVASMQPIHCTSDIDIALRHWGGRSERAYPWRALLDSGARLAFGSDAPVETVDTAAGLHAAVTRRRADGTPSAGFMPAQRIGLDAALAAYTSEPARLAGSWPRLGRLAPGALADVAVWGTDLHRLPAERLAEARVRATILGGAIVFDADHAAAPAAPALAGGAR